MKKFILVAFCLILSSTFCRGGSNIAASISVQHVQAFDYNIKVYLFSKTSLQGSNPLVIDSVHVGFGPTRVFSRTNLINLANDVSLNVYESTVTYPAEGKYLVYFAIPNRIANVYNIPHSVNVPLEVESEIAVINPSLYCPDNSPQIDSTLFFLCPVGKEFRMTPFWREIDNDSLSFSLVASQGVLNTTALGYTFPTGLTINNFSGELRWNAPTIGNYPYNAVIRLDEWRQGFNIGHVDHEIELSTVASTDTNFNFQNIPYQIDNNGIYSMHINMYDTLKLHASFFHLTISDSLLYFSENINSQNHDTATYLNYPDSSLIDIRWIPGQNDIRKAPYLYVIRGIANSFVNDITFMVYVDGNVTDTCPAIPWLMTNQVNFTTFTLYPNPTTDKVYFTNSDFNGAKYRITDCFGRFVYQSFQENSEIDFSGYPSGLYFLSIQIKGKEYFSKIVLE